MSHKIQVEQRNLWNSGEFKNEIENLDFLQACDFLTEKAIEKTGALKDGVFICIKSNYSDVWIEVSKNLGSYFCAPDCYGKFKLIRKTDISHISTEIKKLEYPYKPRIVYTKKGIFGGKKGKPISEFFNDLHYK